MSTYKLKPLAHCLIGAALALAAGTAATQPVSQSPLSVGGDVPGNLLLVPSVEWPTLNSMANLGNYDSNRVYVGYFDPNKCYNYHYSDTEANRHFYPVRTTNDRTCTYTSNEWSGNYLNWAATQTIDPFRKALTGGYRVTDTSTTTILEKARYDGNGENYIYPNRRLPAGNTNSKSQVRAVTPFNWDSITVRIWTLGNKMRFTSTGDLNGSTVYTYNPSSTMYTSRVYEVSVRVKVCDPSVGVESNCKQYPNGNWKPEGLIQKYSNRIRYSVFGYLNDSDMLRDGGVLRARQKFVGETLIDPDTGEQPNPNMEWDPHTGVLYRNPDSADAAATGANIQDSGVINYINKFGQMTSWNHKSHDPVSELYYTAIRYLKKQGNVPEYSALSGNTTNRYNLADGFPVITDWDDPIQYWCQNNAILGIGDANTHRDKNLPGSTATADEPTRPSLVSSDDTVNVVTATNKVAQLEGITINTNQFTGRQNSAFIAGLAYDSHTKDLRPGEDDFEGDQTVSTHWVDVREAQVLEPRHRNQYWLAAKYGGFMVPENYDPYGNTTPLGDELWNSGETLSTGDPRPENFYVASEADKMVESLTSAFAKIVAESAGSASSLAANSTRLETTTMTFQAQFFNGSWRGDLKAYNVLSNGTLSGTPAWTAGTELAKATWSNRNIYVNVPTATPAHKLFTWANLNGTQRGLLGSSDVVDYLRGDRSKEESRAGGTLRTRTSILGDIVNSTPVYVGSPNPRLHAGATYTGAANYAAFANSAVRNRTPVVYVGANDGMLHAFDAATGQEIYAFVPNTVLANLRSYTEPDYEHRYFVDGEIAIADAYVSGAWRTILVGTLGRGGPGVFALDVTNPSSVSLLWEKNGANIPQLGKNIGKPVIAQTSDGDWRVLLGNGPGSTDEDAHLISIRLSDGSVQTHAVGAAGDNGLSAVLARDADGNGIADTAYAGDFKGNLWKFDWRSGTMSVSKLFTAVDANGAAQPITAAPLVGKDPATGTTWVFFGTGQYLHTNDLTDRQVQSWYGIQDTGVLVSGRAELVQRDILAEGTIGDFPVRVIEEGAISDMANKKGWYMDLVSPIHGVEGERMVVPNRFQGTALIGTTRIPDAQDPCRPSGKGFVMAINPFTGARLDRTFFDVSMDGLFTEADMLLVDGVPTIVSGIGMDSSPNNPIFIEDVMQVGLDDGTTKTIKTQGSAVQAQRMSWRELFN